MRYLIVFLRFGTQNCVLVCSIIMFDLVLVMVLFSVRYIAVLFIALRYRCAGQKCLVRHRSAGQVSSAHVGCHSFLKGSWALASFRAKY